MSFIAAKLIGSAKLSGQDIIFAFDPVRGKKLSVMEHALTFSATALNDLGWMRIGASQDALTGFVMPMNATIVRAHVHCGDDRGQEKSLTVWIEDSLILPENGGTIATMPGVAGEVKIATVDRNLDINQLQKIQVRADSVGGRIDDINCTLYYKWRLP